MRLHIRLTEHMG